MLAANSHSTLKKKKNPKKELKSTLKVFSDVLAQRKVPVSQYVYIVHFTMMLTHILAIAFGCCYTGAAKLTDRKKLHCFSVLRLSVNIYKQSKSSWY